MNRKSLFPKPAWVLAALLLVVLTGLGALAYFNLRYQGLAEHVTFSNGDIKLAGVLVRPGAGGSHPAVVLLHGSGEQTHNKWFYRIHTNAFLRHGFAVLSYDKRGSGESGGDLSNATYSDFAADALAAVSFLRNQPGIRPAQIGLLGVSESGWFTPEIAARDGAIAFIVNRVSSPLAWMPTVLFEVRNELIDRGMSEATIDQVLQLQTAIWTFYINGAMDEAVATGPERERLNALISEMDSQPETRGVFGPLQDYDRAGYMVRASKYAYDPQPFVEAIDTPMLYVLAGRDRNVPFVESVAYLEQLNVNFEKVTVRSYPETGHYLYRWDVVPIEGLYVEDYLDVIASWAAAEVAAG